MIRGVPLILSILSSRRSFARELLGAIGAGKIPRADLSAFQVRQIHSLSDAELSRMVGEVWGEIRETPERKKRQIQDLIGYLRHPTQVRLP